MRRVEFSIEVGPVPPDAVERLKAASYRVYKGAGSWRVVGIAPVLGDESVRAQVHVLARQVIADFGLTTLVDPPATSLRDPDTEIDARGTSLILEEARRAYDPDPLTRPKRKFYQRAMELGLGERKGD